MAAFEKDVHDLDNCELGSLVMTTLARREVIMVELRLKNRRRFMRVWTEDPGDSPDGLRPGDPIDPAELAAAR